ncbi:MAG: hypothetical protein OEX12_05850 [Gammaproteobacteria bacterium]|nr:hypothetical protein [Gammaproteobacteria bacterium]
MSGLLANISTLGVRPNKEQIGIELAEEIISRVKAEIVEAVDKSLTLDTLDSSTVARAKRAALDNAIKAIQEVK